MLEAICASAAHSLPQGSWYGLPPAGSGFLSVADSADQDAHSQWRDGPLSCSVFTSLELWREGEIREGEEEGRRME